MTKDVESIERATLAALAPSRLEEVGGWLIPLENGTVGRAKSAVPLRHEEPDLALIAHIESRYLALGLPSMFRLPDVAAFDSFRSVLTGGGYIEGKPTLVQAGRSSFSTPFEPLPGFELAEVKPVADDDWAAVFLGEGFDPVDGASRVATLRRAKGSLFAQVRADDGRAVAVGALALSHGWASVHGMRTAVSHRRRGLALRVLTTLAQEARIRGYERIVLQVEASNTSAQQLYAGCGFATAWSYSYWTQPAR